LALQDLQGQLTRATFTAWLASARLAGLHDGTAVVEVVSEPARAWLASRLERLVREALARAAGREIAKIAWRVRE